MTEIFGEDNQLRELSKTDDEAKEKLYNK